MNTKIKALTFNNSWIFTTLPPGKKAIGCKWIYKTKFHAYGTIKSHKARLVSKGFSQIEVIDFFNTFSCC